MNNMKYYYIIKIIETLYGITIIFSFICLKIISSSLNTRDIPPIKPIYNNWSRGPILSIHSNDQCNKSHTELISDEWHGTVTACNKGNLILEGKCSYEGKTILPIDSKKYKYWRKTKLCTLRSNQTYFDLITTNTICEMDHKPCGKIDTFNNTVCYKNNENCPVNYLAIDNLNKNSDIIKNIHLDNSYLMYSTEKIENNLISEIVVSDGKPCIDRSYINNSFPPYFLEKFHKRFKCKNNEIGDSILDNKFKKIDTYKYYEVLIENDILSEMRQLPYFIKYEISLINQDEKLNLFYKNYIGLNQTCLNHILNNNLSEKILDDINKFENIFNEDQLIYDNIVVIIVNLIFYVFFIIYVLFSKYCLNNNIYFNLRSISIITMLCLFISSVCIIKSFSLVRRIENYGKSYFYISENNCSDYEINELLKISIDFQKCICLFVRMVFISNILNIIFFTLNNIIKYYIK